MKASSESIHEVVRRRPHLRGEVTLPRLAAERGLQMVRLYKNWPTALADRLGFLRSRHVLYRLRYGGATIELVARANGCDVRTISEIWIGKLYDSFVPVGNAAGPGPVVLDIGTNCGYFAVYMATRHPHSRLFCYEPEATNRALANTNLFLNGIAATVSSKAVIADTSPTVRLSLSHDPRLHTTVPFEHADKHGISSERYSGRVVTVQAININDAVAAITKDGRIDLLKVDVEGIDLALIFSLNEELLSRIDCIVVETEGQDTGAIADRMRSNGFIVFEDAGLLFAYRSRISSRPPLGA